MYVFVASMVEWLMRSAAVREDVGANPTGTNVKHILLSFFVYMSKCLYVRGLFPHSTKTIGPIFEIQTPIIRVKCRIGYST